MENEREHFDDDSTENLVAKLRETFKEEAYELLSELETALLELEKTPDDRDLVGRVFRAMHTIKGSGATCELTDISAFTHEIETFFDQVRKGKIAVTREIIDLTLTARDHIQTMFDRYYRGGTTDEARGQEILASFRTLLPASVAEGKPVPPSAPAGQRYGTSVPKKDASGKTVTYRIRLHPRPDGPEQGADPLPVLTRLRQLGPCRVVAQTEDIPSLEDFRPGSRYTCWDVILTTARGTDAIHDVLAFVGDTSEVKIDIIDEEDELDDEKSRKRLGEILAERGDLSEQDLEKVLCERKRIGELLVETGLVSNDKVESALAEQVHVREVQEKRRKEEVSSSVRVPAEKLDSLVNLVGELVTVQARLSQTVSSQGNPELLSIAEDIERLTAELRDNALSIRMLPIGTTFSRFKRLVRDLSAQLGKEVELTTDGAETELDKTVIERLGDPLVHLIRNSIDHGIETPDVRETAGKPQRGTVHLSAKHSGAHVLIRVQDDGAGLDIGAVRTKALERGIIQPDAELSDKDLQALIFAPGFSTAKNVTSVSGRGVGLDVVKKSIDALRGEIDICSQKGVGTAITLKLPLTLAIIDGFLTQIGSEWFVMPLSLVVECVELTRTERQKARGRNLAMVREELVPYIRLRDQFGINGEVPAVEQIVITGGNGGKVGFVVDRVIGSYQTVIKNLGRFYRNVDSISGATILGDGTVALILDVPRLVERNLCEEVQPVACTNSSVQQLAKPAGVMLNMKHNGGGHGEGVVS